MARFLSSSQCYADMVLCTQAGRGHASLECFKEIYNLCFGPAVRGTRLSELARLPFVSTVQDYSDRFNAVLCHACNLFAPQKAELFVGGLPEHIKVDVELREPQDLQTAMYRLGRLSVVLWLPCWSLSSKPLLLSTNHWHYLHRLHRRVLLTQPQPYLHCLPRSRLRCWHLFAA